MTVAKFMATQYAGLTDTYFKFTFVRNPYDRIYSGYLQDRFAAANYPRWTIAKKKLFDSIGDDFNVYFNRDVMKSDVRNDWRWICFCPMQEFTHHRGEKVIDFFGKSEDFQADLEQLSRHLGIRIEKAPDENVRPASPVGAGKYLDKYSRATIENVNRMYAEDFALFGYEMQDPSGFPDRVPPTATPT